MGNIGFECLDAAVGIIEHKQLILLTCGRGVRVIRGQFVIFYDNYVS